MCSDHVAAATATATAAVAATATAAVARLRARAVLFKRARRARRPGGYRGATGAQCAGGTPGHSTGAAQRCADHYLLHEIRSLRRTGQASASSLARAIARQQRKDSTSFRAAASFAVSIAR